VAVITAALAGPPPPPAVLIDSGLSFVRSDKYQAYASAAFDGTNWLVVWQDKRNDDQEAVWGARVSSAGVLLDSVNICIADQTEERTVPKVAFNGTNYLVVWQDGRNHSYDIYGTRVSPAGVILDPSGIQISRSDETDEYPSVASNGSDFLVVWQDKRNSGNDEDIFGARVSGSGQVLDTANIAVAAATAKQQVPTVAACSGGWLVAWEDSRNEATAADDIYAARVTTSGSVLDPAGIIVSHADSIQYCPQPASDGTNCLIVWGDSRNGSGDVYGARVSDAGAVLDPSGLAIHASPNFWAGDPYVAYTGNQYLVVWEDDSITGGYDCDLLASRVTTGGQVLDPEGVVVTQASYDQYWPVIAKGSANLLVAWQSYPTNDDADIYANLVNPSGVPLDTTDNLLSMVVYPYEQFNPAAAFDGTNFLTVWHDTRAPETQQYLYGARITQSGSLLDPGGFFINASSAGIMAPAVAFGSSNYLVAWDCSAGSNYWVNALRVTPSGAVLDSNPIYTAISGSGGDAPAVAFDGTNWFVVAAFNDFGGLANVQGVRITQDGQLVDTHAIRLAYIPRGLNWPAVAFGATSYLAVWSDYRSSSTYDIYGARVSTDGTVLDTAIAISTAATSQYSPSVAFDGTNWLVTWQDNRNGGERELFGARVSQSGTVLDPSGIRLGRCYGNVDDAVQLAFDGTNYFAVWQWRDYSNGDLWGARISSAGTVIDTFPVCTAPEYQATPAIAIGPGGKVFVTYSGYVAALHGYPAEKMRIWAGIYPFYGIEETPNAELQTPNVGPSILRGVLHLGVGSRQHSAYRAELLDAAGRKVLDLQAGVNDVSNLAPGVYFVHSPLVNRHSSISKVVLTR